MSKNVFLGPTADLPLALPATFSQRWGPGQVCEPSWGIEGTRACVCELNWFRLSGSQFDHLPPEAPI